MVLDPSQRPRRVRRRGYGGGSRRAELRVRAHVAKRQEDRQPVGQSQRRAQLHAAGAAAAVLQHVQRLLQLLVVRLGKGRRPAPPRIVGFPAPPRVVQARMLVGLLVDAPPSVRRQVHRPVCPSLTNIPTLTTQLISATTLRFIVIVLAVACRLALRLLHSLHALGKADDLELVHPDAAQVLTLNQHLPHAHSHSRTPVGAAVGCLRDRRPRSRRACAAAPRNARADHPREPPPGCPARVRAPARARARQRHGRRSRGELRGGGPKRLRGASSRPQCG